MKLINQIRTGDQILTIDKWNLISTEFMFMLDQNSIEQGFTLFQFLHSKIDLFAFSFILYN